IHVRAPPGFSLGKAPAVTNAPSAPAKTPAARPSTPVKKSPPPVAQAPKAPPKQQNTTASYKKTQSNSGSKTAQSSNKVQWFWPGTGPIIETYSTTGRINKGINLGGSIGDPVYSAANGEVVYAGSGLLGYGLLIIINHNEQY